MLLCLELGLHVMTSFYLIKMRDSLMGALEREMRMQMHIKCYLCNTENAIQAVQS